MDTGDRGTLGRGNGPTAAQKVDLETGIGPAAKVERQVQIPQGRRRARPDLRALLRQGLVPGDLGAVAGAAANGGIWTSDLTIQNHLSGGVIADVFISQERYQALLPGAEAAFDLALGLWTGGDQRGNAQGTQGALKLRTRVSIIGHGIMTEEAQAVGVHDPRQSVLEKEAAKMLEMIPGRVGGDKDRAQEFSGMVIHGQQEGLLVGRRPPLVEGRVGLPEFTQTGALPAPTGFGARFCPAHEVGKVRPDKGGDRLTMALEIEASFQLIGGQAGQWPPPESWALNPGRSCSQRARSR